MPPPGSFLLTSLQMRSHSLWLAPLLNMGVISNKGPSLLPPTHNPHVACCVAAVGDLLYTCNVNAQLDEKSHDIKQLFGCIISWDWLHHMSIILL